MQTDSLLNLLLAYSASHQSRLLKRIEPTERISGFLGETVRSLTESLNDPVALKSDATLATAIMLCSYEIISPNSFAEGITWQTHLNAVRKIIMARGGADEMHSADEVSYFLSRWFAYLDVLGSLSGRDTHPLFKGDYWILDDNNGTTDFSVDCFFGTTNRYVSLLAQVGDLARKCEELKGQFVENAQQLGYQDAGSEWRPEGDLYDEAIKLRNVLEESRHGAMESCTHVRKDENENEGEDDDVIELVPSKLERENRELLATNDAYHWAAQIHLARRVFNLPAHDSSVQENVTKILTAMQEIGEASNTINCWLFPMFIAGCESTDDSGRDVILQRMVSMEQSGLTQIQRARELMEKVWNSGNPWESLANGEFIG